VLRRPREPKDPLRDRASISVAPFGGSSRVAETARDGDIGEVGFASRGLCPYAQAVATQAVLYAHGLDRLSAFYADCIGLTPAEMGEGYRELQADDLVLWLVRGQAPAPKLDPNGSVMRRSEVPLKLGFAVESIDRVARTIESFGGTVAKTSWEFAGYRRRDAVDPEGNVIQLLEPLAG
jgi:predicted enzyme related to lactoylglutathione lyase